MFTVYNKGYCFYCGELTDNYEDVGHSRLYWCGCADGGRELEHYHREMMEDAQYEAERDEYRRYW
jgi:hypothetical protein